MVELPFRAYRGDGPYIFVSYAHVDADQVFRELERLARLDINVWYDEGISPGSSWRTELAHAISECDLFVFFATAHSVQSETCVKEVNYAMDRGKPILVIHLEKVALPLGLDLALSDIQAILKYEFSEEAYAIRLADALSISLETQPVPPQKNRQRPVGFIASAMATVVIALVLWWSLPFYDQPVDVTGYAPPPHTSPVILVLPIEVQGEINNIYLTSAIYNDVHQRVSELPDVKVIGRISAMRFQDSMESLDGFAGKVGATHILSVVLQPANDSARINSEIIEMVGQTQLWSSSHDFPLSSSNDIGRQLLPGIASTLNLTVDIAEQPDDGTPAADVYQQYLEARERLQVGGADNIRQGLALLGEVIEKAPTFEEAHSLIAIAVDANQLGSSLGNWASRSAQTAIDLNPNSANANLAMGLFTRGRASLDYFERAVALNPNDSRTRMLYGYRLVSNSLMNEAFEQWQTALHLDPLSPMTHLAMANALSFVNKTQEEERHLERALELEPDNPEVLFHVANYRLRHTDPVGGIRLLTKAHELLPESASVTARIAGTFLGLRQLDTAEQWVLKIPADTVELATLRYYLLMQSNQTEEAYQVASELLRIQDNVPLFKGLLAGATAVMAAQAYREERYTESERQRQRAVELYKEALSDEFSEGHYLWDLDNQHVISQTMVILASLGDHAQAAAIAGDILAVNRPQNEWAGVDFHRGLALAVLGRHDEAIDAFAELLIHDTLFLSGTWFEHYILQMPYGHFDGLRNNVRFLQVVDALHRREAAWASQLAEEFPAATQLTGLPKRVSK